MGPKIHQRPGREQQMKWSLEKTDSNNKKNCRVPSSSSLRSSLSIRLQLTTEITHMADDEVVDPKKYLEESCNPKCVKPLLEYQACVKRIQGDDSGQKHCTGQYFDYWQCIDKCVAPKLFTKLK